MLRRDDVLQEREIRAKQRASFSHRPPPRHPPPTRWIPSAPWSRGSEPRPKGLAQQATRTTGTGDARPAEPEARGSAAYPRASSAWRRYRERPPPAASGVPPPRRSPGDEEDLLG